MRRGAGVADLSTLEIHMWDNTTLLHFDRDVKIRREDDRFEADPSSKVNTPKEVISKLSVSIVQTSKMGYLEEEKRKKKTRTNF